MIRIVCTSDNHLGRYYAKMNFKQLNERRQILRQAFEQVVNFAIRQQAHLFLHCGDLFDRESPPPAELTFVAQQFQKLREANIRILAISGNHDMPMASDGATPVRIYDALRAVHVFSKRTQIEFDYFEIQGTRVAVGGLAPDPRLEPRADPLQGVEYTAPEADVALLLLHGGYEGNIPPDFVDPILPKSRVANLKGIDYLFLGDIHRTHKAVVDHATVIIPGATERMGFGELGEKPGFYYAELEGKQAVKLLHKEIDPQPMRREVIRTTNIPPEEPTEYVFDQLRQWSERDQMMQLKIEGPLTREVYHHLRFFDIWLLGNELNFFFDLDRAAVTLKGEERGGNGGGAEIISTRREIERVAAELAAEREGDERALIEEARELVLQRMGKEE
ncbi:MAG TPA: DNA repair exonuclease [Anaerolineae bacterium]